MSKYYKPKRSMLDKYIEVDDMRQKIYNACATGFHSFKELSEITGFTVSKIKHSMVHLLEKEYVTQTKIFTKDISRSLMRIRVTDKVYKARTKEQIQSDIDERYRKQNEPLVAGKYDELIAKNPALRKIRLFEEKDQDYFKQPLKKSGKTHIGSTFSIYDNFAD